MKLCLAILMLLTPSILPAAEAYTNLLSIHLVDAKLPRKGTTRLDDLKLISPPVLSDSDFLSFNTTNHTFVITADAAKRLSRGIWDLAKREYPSWGDAPRILGNGGYELIVCPTPFVIKASGEAIYAGSFYVWTSSDSFAGPVILSAVYSIRTDSTNSVPFRIEMGYPWSISGVADPRGDSRIALAAQKLFVPRVKP
jgi:hypothetical protein